MSNLFAYSAFGHSQGQDHPERLPPGFFPLIPQGRHKWYPHASFAAFRAHGCVADFFLFLVWVFLFHSRHRVWIWCGCQDLFVLGSSWSTVGMQKLKYFILP